MTTYKFFWSGPFSQWFSSVFTDESGVTYCTAEQYMMYQKALLFNDTFIAKQILETRDPKAQKSLGRQVRNFDAVKWNDIARDVVYRGNKLKFTQNPVLLDKLLRVKDDIFVEASPYDRICGIGLNESMASQTPPENWPGTNWLGEVLTRLRNELREEYATA